VTYAVFHKAQRRDLSGEVGISVAVIYLSEIIHVELGLTLLQNERM